MREHDSHWRIDMAFWGFYFLTLLLNLANLLIESGPRSPRSGPQQMHIDTALQRLASTFVEDIIMAPHVLFNNRSTWYLLFSTASML
jgi:hypothetical protein